MAKVTLKILDAFSLGMSSDVLELGAWVLASDFTF